MNSYYTELRACLESQFYADNFAHIAQISFEAAGAADRPLPFMLLWSIFFTLEARWRDRRMDDTVARQMEHHLRAPILDYVSAAEKGINSDEELRLLNRISAAYRSWLAVQMQILYGDWANR